MKNIFLFSALIICVFFITQCKSKPAAAAVPENPLNGTWELNYISGSRIAFDGLFPKTKPTIIFHLPDTLATGNGGCNGYSCKIKIEGNRISFGDALSTMMYCEPGGEQVYFKTLKSISSYSVSEGHTLNMIMGDIAVMRFSKKQ